MKHKIGRFDVPARTLFRHYRGRLRRQGRCIIVRRNGGGDGRRVLWFARRFRFPAERGQRHGKCGGRRGELRTVLQRHVEIVARRWRNHIGGIARSQAGRLGSRPIRHCAVFDFLSLCVTAAGRGDFAHGGIERIAQRGVGTAFAQLEGDVGEAFCGGIDVRRAWRLLCRFATANSTPRRAQSQPSAHRYRHDDCGSRARPKTSGRARLP